MSILGTTFSHRYARQLGLDPRTVFSDILSLGFSHIRLCCYWDEIQPHSGMFDYSAVEPFLDICEARHISVLMTVGEKAPRWPEFYRPAWASPDDVLPFVRHAVSTLRKYSCIGEWQVENEPLDPSGPENKVVGADILRQEIDAVRELDSRPIAVTVWGNVLSGRGLLPVMTALGDIVGADIYYRVPGMLGTYSGPDDSDTAIAHMFKTCGKPVWLTEFQAEPWEPDGLVTGKTTPSISPAILEKNIRRARTLDTGRIYLWGSEFWEWKKLQGDNSYWDLMRVLMADDTRT